MNMFYDLQMAQVYSIIFLGVLGVAFIAVVVFIVLGFKAQRFYDKQALPELFPAAPAKVEQEERYAYGEEDEQIAEYVFSIDSEAPAPVEGDAESEDLLRGIAQAAEAEALPSRRLLRRKK